MHKWESKLYLNSQRICVDTPKKLLGHNYLNELRLYSSHKSSRQNNKWEGNDTNKSREKWGFLLNFSKVNSKRLLEPKRLNFIIILWWQLTSLKKLHVTLSALKVSSTVERIYVWEFFDCNFYLAAIAIT